MSEIIEIGALKRCNCCGWAFNYTLLELCPKCGNILAIDQNDMKATGVDNG